MTERLKQGGMTNKDLADFLRRRWDGKNVVYSKDAALPEPNLRHSTVTLYTDQLKKFRDHLVELQVFAAQVCGVPVDELCLMDMWAFLMKQSGRVEALEKALGDVHKLSRKIRCSQDKLQEWAKSALKGGE